MTKHTISLSDEPKLPSSQKTSSVGNVIPNDVAHCMKKRSSKESIISILRERNPRKRSAGCKDEADVEPQYRAAVFDLQQVLYLS